jgi:DNA repair exonuclease SbcCD ATPase subunit
MSFKHQTGSRKGSSKQFSKTAHEKKSKEKKQRAGAKYLQEETPQATTPQVAERTINSLGKLGSQIFALSPFSQYFDDWLLNLRQLISEFEANPTILSDEQFERERMQIIQDVEGALAEKRIQESNLTDEAKALADVNHKIADADREYTDETKELSNKRNSEVQRLSNKIRELEDTISATEEAKFGFFQFKEKKQNQEKLVRTQHELKANRTQLETSLASFTAEQEKLHDSYQKHKQDLSEESDHLHKKLEKLETDTSAEARQTACNALAESINSLLKRMPAVAQT